MRIALTEQFQRDVRGLSEDELAAVFEAILILPGALGDPHRHAGLGLRKVSPRGVWEVRIGLRLRILFDLQANTASLVRVGTHDEILRFLRSL